MLLSHSSTNITKFKQLFCRLYHSVFCYLNLQLLYFPGRDKDWMGEEDESFSKVRTAQQATFYEAEI